MDSIINVRTNSTVKNQAQKIFSSMGMSTSTAVNMFLRQVVTEKKLPFIPATKSSISNKK